MPDRITSLQNQRVKEVVRLRDRPGRDAQQRILIDGAREIARALDARIEVEEIFTDSDSANELEQQVLDAAQRAGAAIVNVSPAVLKKLLYGDRETGLIAVARPPRHRLDELKLSEDVVVAVLEHLEKPGNLGAIVRSADAAGVAALIVAEGSTDLYNPNAIRASAGTIFSLPVVAAGVEETLQWLRTNKFRIYASRVEGSTRFWDVVFEGRTALALGSEAHGLSARWESSDIQPVSIPQQGAADSLNVSVTAALLFYEVVRQRGVHAPK